MRHEVPIHGVVGNVFLNSLVAVFCKIFENQLFVHRTGRADFYADESRIEVVDVETRECGRLCALDIH